VRVILHPPARVQGRGHQASASTARRFASRQLLPLCSTNIGDLQADRRDGLSPSSGLKDLGDALSPQGPLLGAESPGSPAIKTG